MDVIEQVALLKAQAIELLIAERHRIDAVLASLQPGQEKAPAKRRGRPPRPISDQLYTTQSALTSPLSEPASSTHPDPHQEVA